MQTRKNGFSLVELLMVLGVMSLLMGMLIPSVGVVRAKAQRMATGHKLRQISLAVATYQSVTGRALAGNNLADCLSRLAEQTGVSEGPLFIFEEDPLVAAIPDSVPPVLIEQDQPGVWAAVEGFADWPLGIVIASGISPLANPSTTPVVWTRGLTAEGVWQDFGQNRAGIYGSEGGFIAFLDGHVEFYRDLAEDGGQLVTSINGQRTADIRDALGPGAMAYDYLGRVF
ncbi:type II secretion system protein [Puniceicoccales bacterium CK1056]|uniref:Type II secretion system protein n=1 Tax=Oceanipulchritudo coccoides TaxID=2706888 RepID=A0A6B2M193_9BACT|nr:type II secretion system protein [Oceanipulchritudo coccoides]NDV62483.1 type II secretion system protein [Oceanipulchritudo coccoides]